MEASHGVKVFRGQRRRSTTRSLCITPHRHPPPPLPHAWVQLWQKSSGRRLRVAEMQIGLQGVAVIYYPLSSLSCWVKEEWEWSIPAEQWSVVAIITTITLITPPLHLPQSARRNCPVSPILHPAPPLPLSRHLKIVPLPPRPSLLPRSTRPPAWENARGSQARGPIVPCPLSPPQPNGHPRPTLRPKRVAKKGSRRTKGRYRSWRSRMSAWKQRLKGWVKRCREHVGPW